MLSINLIDKMNYFRFLFQSSNQHGVHSPFVFNYLTKAIYRPHRNTRNRKRYFIDQSISYFKPKNIVDIRHSDTLDIKATFDMLIFLPNQLDLVLNNELIEDFKNDTVGIIDCRKSSKDDYLKIYQHPKTTVVLHFYWYIVFFARKEQQKELFFLRL